MTIHAEFHNTNNNTVATTRPSGGTQITGAAEK